MNQEMDIVVISLKHATARRDAAARQLNSTGLRWNFLDAVDGRDLQVLEGYERKKRLRLKGYELSRGEIGCFMSHRRAWENCVTHDRPCLVLEDDFRLNSHLPDTLQTAYGLREQYDLLRLHGSIQRKTKVMRTCSGYALVKFNKDPLDTAAYIIAPRGAERLLEKSRTYFLSVDNFLAATWLHGIRIRGLLPYPVLLSEAHGKSTIVDRIETRLSIRAKLLKEMRRAPYGLVSSAWRLWDYHMRG